MKRRCATAALLAAWGLAAVVLAEVAPGRAQTPAPPSARLDILWSSQPGRADIVGDQRFRLAAAGVDGSVIVTGWRGNEGDPVPMLLTQAQERGLEGGVPIQWRRTTPVQRIWSYLRTGIADRMTEPLMPGIHRHIRAYAFARGDVWLGGAIEDGVDWISREQCRTYLLRVRGDGTPLWQQTYRYGACIAIEGIAIADNGDALAVGRQDHRWAWLARITPDGHLLWERRIGEGAAVAVVPLGGGRFLIVGLAGYSRSADRSDMSAWILDATGEVREARLLHDMPRQSTSTLPSPRAVTASATENGAYVAFDPTLGRDANPMEVALIGAQGDEIWRRVLPETVGPGRMFGVKSCSTPALATLPNGDALLACAVRSEIQLYRLARATGDPTETRTPLPDCGDQRVLALFLMVNNGEMFLAGHSHGPGAPGCSWLGRLHLGSG